MGLTPLESFAADVGPPEAGPVTCVGGRTQWSAGGAVDDGAREVRAPAGVVQFVPAEMIVRCGAGTTVDELQRVVADGGMQVAIESAGPASTVGGVLAVGRNGVRTLGWGPVRDVLLEARFVSWRGEVVKAGGPVVKNVSGFDLCRLLVGSLGTLGFLGEVVLRCRPLPAVARWFSGPLGDPIALTAALYRPASVLSDGSTTWVLLEGHGDDVDGQHRDVLAPAGFTEVDGPPPLTPAVRVVVTPGRFADAGGASPVEPAVAELNRRIKSNFDPTGRLNPGRRVWTDA
jgi:glycolate oxidase FAD binding subunit